MTRILRLLLIVAVALPYFGNASAQNVASLGKGGLQLTDVGSADMQSMPTNLKMKKDDSSQKGGVSLKGVNPPSSGKVEAWTISTTWQYTYYNYWRNGTFWTNTVDVMVFGNNIYIRGLCNYVHDAWIKGTLDGTTANFGGQIQCGLSDGGEMIYLDGINSSDEWTDIVFTYNPGEKTLTLANGIYILESTYGEPDEEGNFSVTPKSRHSSTTIKSAVEANVFCPVYGYWYDANSAQHSQMIYPESSLIFYKNSKLKSITFYTQEGIKFYDGNVTISLAISGESAFSTTSSAPINATLTQVASVTPSVTNTSAWTITFNEPFEYKGGNLLIDIVTAKGGYGQTSFYLESTDSYSSYYSNYNNNYGNTCIKYLPVITFGYERLYEERNITVLTPDEVAAIPYSWKENGTGTSHSGTLDEVATDPDQIIAMLKEVYTNKGVPGNYKRGFTTEGTSDHDDDVPYTAVGTLSVNDGTATFSDDYGWQFNDSEVTKLSGTSGSYQYWYMDPEQYKPNKEGLTLVLLELKDSFTPKTVTDEETGEVLEGVILNDEASGYAQLRDCVEKTIKSARIISQSKRTGEGMGKGTLFKIDCDKMNKFYLIAKGQLLWFSGSGQLTGKNFYENPCYINGNGVDEYVDKLLDNSYYESYPFLCHMFEQFSPALGGAEVTKDDIYQELTKNMQSFGVDHDCPNVPYVLNGHHFMMYDAFSEASDCQDVRDMMFFIPDYRMMDHSTRGAGTNQDYFRYNPRLQPTMGMFVIKQNAIPNGSIISSDTEKMTGIYKHQLSWKSNLDEFLPGDEQVYQLWEVVVDEFGVESYVPVYYRNADGSYVLDEQGQKTPIVLERQNLKEFIYTDVYVDMTAGSQTKTYVVRGQDKGGFMSLQMSNQEEIIIPGLDPNEKARMIAATYYSRYNPDNEKNCYSNKIELSNNGMTLTAEDLAAANNKVNFYRLSRAAQLDDSGNVVTDEAGNILYVDSQNITKELVATGTISNNTLTITLTEPSTIKDEFPIGESDKNSAGYHPNSTLSFPYSTNNSGVIQFTNGFSFWDNFTVDVSNNAHPLQYLYKMEIGDVYSNDVRVPVYKTDSKINSYSLSDVLNDIRGDVELEDAEFGTKVQMSSKTELLRYDAYRWNEKQSENDCYYIIDAVGTDSYGNLVESDKAPTGIAGNQGEWYTVSMNDVEQPEYYYSATNEDQPTVSVQNPYNWATFIDYYPRRQPNAGAYTYAPVVELYTKGYKDNLVNNKRVERNDYNTYGGPQQNSAAGKLEVEVVEPSESNPLMSDSKWQANGKWYSYYNILLNFKALAIPEGYELYKVRAWRNVDRNILKENTDKFPTRAARISNIDENGYYLYEDINYGDQLDETEADGSYMTMSYENLKNSNAPKIGQRSVVIAKPQNPGDTSEPEAMFADAMDGETRATFGALRLKLGEDDQYGTLDELKAEFKVRAYFTRKSNPLVDNNKHATTKAINRDVADDGFDYYIAEGTVDFSSKDYETIPTGLENLNARQVVGVKYYNVAGIESDTPFQGVNIVVTRYSDGSSSTVKVLK